MTYRTFNFEREWDYRYTERLGILCGAAEPTPAQKRIARQEADVAIAGFREQLKLLDTFECAP